MFGIGGFELFLILLFGFLIFGPEKLPQIANTIGKAIARFRTAQEEMSGQLKMDDFMDKESDQPFKNPLDVIEGAASKAKEGADAARTKADAATDKVIEHTDSFAARKAAYDAARRERKEAEAKAAKEAEEARAKAEAKAKAKEDPKTEVAPKKAASAADDDAPTASDASAKEVS
ncbi:MAG: twin-arginine translocase TatA/TatE family subunit [Eggerthellaceae bacterium]|nr:twin-arginine translocase TatA/TatE family subunit [Eggerthellaceae bacterium]